MVKQQQWGRLIGVFFFFMLSACASKNVIFTTSSSVGLDVSGNGATLPTHVAVAYDRQEFVYVPKGETVDPSVLGSMDTELTWFKGIAVSETFATGRAAHISASKTASDGQEEDPGGGGESQPMLIVTGTQLGLALNLGNQGLTAPSFIAGYKRTNLAVVPPRPDSGEIQSVYADISIHSSGINGQFTPDSKRFQNRKLSPDSGGGVRIVQHIGTGKAADEWVSEHQESVSEKLIPLEQFKKQTTKYELIDNIMVRYRALSANGKSSFISELNTFANNKAELNDEGSLKASLHGLTEEEKKRAYQEVKELYNQEKEV